MGLLFITLQRQKHGVVLWSEWEISHCLRLLTGLGSAPAITRITWALAISLSHPLLFSYYRRVDFTSVWRRKPEYGAREQAPKQGRKNPLWQSALAWHRSKQAYGKAKRMRNALSGRTGTWCRVLQDRLLDKSSRLFDMPGANLSAPTLLNFPLDSVYWEDTTGTTLFSHPSVHSLFLALCFIVSQAESAAVGKISCCFVLLPHFFPPPAPVFATCLRSASTCFMLWVCIDWPAASVYAYFGLGATCKPFAVSNQYSWFDIRVAWLVNEVTELCLCSLIRWLNLC